jgi:hypothetical protein
MKKSLRLALALAAVLTVGTMPVFATVSGTNPPPPPSAFSAFSVVINTVLTVF